MIAAFDVIVTQEISKCSEMEKPPPDVNGGTGPKRAPPFCLMEVKAMALLELWSDES